MEIEINLEILKKLLSEKAFASFEKYSKMQIDVEAVLQMSVVTPMKKDYPLQVVLFHKWGPDGYEYLKDDKELDKRYGPYGPYFYSSYGKDALKVDEYHINTGYKGKQKLFCFVINIKKKANLTIFKK